MDLLMPESGLLFWMTIVFLIVFLILWKWGFPSIVKMVNERKAFIDESIKKAHEANERLANIQKESESMLQEAREKQATILKEAAEPENDAPEVADSDLARPSDLAWYFNAGSLADAKGTIPGWAATDRPDIVRLWVPKTVLSIGSFAFKGCANLEEIVFEASPDGADQLIGTMAFAKCPKLEKVLLSSSVRSIGDGMAAGASLQRCPKRA